MKCKKAFIICQLFAASAVFALPPVSISINPAMSIPLGENDAFFDYGGGANLSFEYLFPGAFAAALGASIGCDYATTELYGDFLVFAAGARASLNLQLAELLLISGFAGGGYHHAVEYDFTEYQASGSGFVEGGIEVSFILTQAFSLGIGADYRWNVGFNGLLRPFIGTTLRFGGAPTVQSAVPTQPAPQPVPEPLEIPPRGGVPEVTAVALEKVFPVFFSYYNTNPVGSVSVTNNSNNTVTDVKVSIFVNTYMDVPKSGPALSELTAGETAELEVYALFNDSILNITEGKQVAATFTIDYMSGGEKKQETHNEVLEISYRNAMTWDDDRKAAVFITAKDPAVLSFARNVKSIVDGMQSGEIDQNLKVAIAIHEALLLHGITYTSDPKNPFAEKRKAAVDFLQFPRETLEYRAGDCDDLSILYCALLESLSVETAFVLVPGHIYMAARLSMTEDEARRSFSRPDELIFDGGNVWVPIEATIREGGFQQAWLEGAKQWREHTSREQAAIIPVHHAWEVYSPVQLPGSGASIPLPPRDSIGDSFAREVKRFITREISPKVATLESQIAQSGGSYRYINRLGVLYARYGLLDQAELEFSKIVNEQEYGPALINLGHILKMKKDELKALEYYERALEIEPENTRAILATAQLHHELENYGMVGTLYHKLRNLDADLAERFAYLDLRGTEANRAAESGKAKGVVVWDEE